MMSQACDVTSVHENLGGTGIFFFTQEAKASSLLLRTDFYKDFLWEVQNYKTLYAVQNSRAL